MTDRVARLRQAEPRDRSPSLSTERAELMTDFYRDGAGRRRCRSSARWRSST